MTAKGKIPTMTALVVVGNGSGGAGIGEAKNEEAGKAIKKATERAIKNMIQFDRYDNRTIFHDIEHKFKATKLKLFARPPGFGVRTNHNIHEVCHCLGITDLAGKVYGSCNPMNVIKAFFDALLSQNTPGNIAKSRGKKIVDVQYQYYGVKTKYDDY
ncbi:28S ribosomal protein S5, mitochondrial [Entomophthora muscae]|nr:28S ribosomal protein S5, mitochondrial [Entomophthora muscae]